MVTGEKEMKQKTFEVKEEHLKLLRKMQVEWNDGEFGAPTISCKHPFGNSDVIQDVAEIVCDVKEVGNEILKIKWRGEELFIKGEDKHNIDFESEPGLYDALTELYMETEMVLQIVLNTGQFKVGKYELVDEYETDWKMVE